MNTYMGSDVEDFIFNEGTSYTDPELERELNEYGIIECVDDPDVACYRIALENEQNFNAINNALMLNQISALESGRTYVSEGTIKDGWEKIKEAIKKFWAKVKGVFKKLMDHINSIVLSNKSFVKKYRAVKVTKPTSGKKFTGFRYNLDCIRYSNIISYLTNIHNMASDKDKTTSRTYTSATAIEFKTIYDNMRGTIIGQRQGITAENFGMALKTALQGSANSEALPLDDFSRLLDRLETAKDVKKYAQNAYKEVETVVKDMLDTIKKNENLHDDYISDYTKAHNQALSIMSTALSAQVKAITAQAVQDRKMANYWIRSQERGYRNESYEYDYDGLDNVEII